MIWGPPNYPSFQQKVQTPKCSRYTYQINTKTILPLSALLFIAGRGEELLCAKANSSVIGQWVIYNQTRPTGIFYPLALETGLIWCHHWNQHSILVHSNKFEELSMNRFDVIPIFQDPGDYSGYTCLWIPEQTTKIIKIEAPYYYIASLLRHLLLSTQCHVHVMKKRQHSTCSCLCRKLEGGKMADMFTVSQPNCMQLYHQYSNT